MPPAAPEISVVLPEYVDALLCGIRWFPFLRAHYK
jgi:hypothetical protein